MRRQSSPVPIDVVVVGVDIAKRNFVAVRLLGDGSWSRAKTYDNSGPGFSRFYEDASGAEAPYIVAVEPTGHYGERFLQWLTDRAVAVHQVQPVHTKRAKELFDGTKRKTDAKDARVIAELCRRGLAKPHLPLEGPFAELRILARHREGLVKRRAQVLQRLHYRLDVVFPEFLEHFYELNSNACLELLRLAPSPQDFLQHDPSALVEAARRVSRGRLGADLVAAVRDAAARTSGITRGTASHAMAIQQGVAELQTLSEHIGTAESCMKALLSEVDYAGNLLSVPRLGAVTVAILLGEFGDFRNYDTARQLIAMAGLDLIEQSSGQRKGRRYISRRGRRYARQVLYLAALRLGWNVLAEPRRRLVEDNKVAPIKATVANMSRLLRILHALVRDDAQFDASLHAPSVESEVAA